MKKWKKIILYLFVLGIVSAVVVFYIATKRPPTAADSKPFKELEATALINELDTSAGRCSVNYMDKNIAVSGIIKSIDTSTANVIIDAGSSCYINCSFDSTCFKNCMNTLAVGKKASIKGIYFGCEGFEKKSEDEFDMLGSEKNAKLKACAINN
jgi:hypothetical protein